eukprot:CAMPEP_0179022702 /NCGR_PEP_ID=MMETSP0796-20121207/6547_1 /TAXON_ID=73915 /ORGANISM="Pyrodinium bahamense, Strain pbaha01" /LENGTH=49 /DNA_ID= /DNA_START= /DNA_END= /DNA_ORIENTATION=
MACRTVKELPPQASNVHRGLFERRVRQRQTAHSCARCTERAENLMPQAG